MKFPGRGAALTLSPPLRGIFTDTWISDRLNPPSPPALSLPRPQTIQSPTSCLPAQPKVNGTTAQGTPGARARPGLAGVEERIGAGAQVSAQPLNPEL